MTASTGRGSTIGELGMLRDSVRGAMRARAARIPGDGWPQSWVEDWEALTESGFWSTAEEPDGSVRAATLVVEELACALYPGPACEALTAAFMLSRSASGRSIDAIADGLPPAVFVADGLPSIQPTPASLLIYKAETGGLHALPSAEAAWRSEDSLDVTRHIARPHISKSATAPIDIEPILAETAQHMKALLYCADSLGCVDHVLQRTADYAAQRTTSGVPIGKYQAVAHRLVDHWVTVQQIRLLVQDAADGIDDDHSDAAERVAIAESLCHGRSGAVISDCVQLAGAIGFTWEFGHHFYLRRVIQNVTLAGRPGRPAQRLAAEASW